jgi:hypothetical protein
MKLTFEQAFDRLIGHEGEFTDDPRWDGQRALLVKGFVKARSILFQR